MNVAVERTVPEYPVEPPFHPHARYPEYPFQDVSGAPNHAYDAVRNALYHLGLDTERFGTAQWNPLRGLVKPDGTVVVKPNFVNHMNPLSGKREYFDALITHASVLRAVIDYVLLSGTEVRVVIADLPIQGADLSRLQKESGMAKVIEFYGRYAPGRISFIDLRTYYLDVNDDGSINKRIELAGDPIGYGTVDLGSASRLVPLEGQAHLFAAADYEGNDTFLHHSSGRHRYVLSNTILSSDLFINVPKMKVHRKTGVTLSLKNLVGIIGDKACLPHWRKGDPSTNGDEFAAGSPVKRLRREYSLAFRKMGPLVWKAVLPFGRLITRMDASFQKARTGETLCAVTNGDWYGNDTIWRMVHDLNAIIVFADNDGKLRDAPQRKYLTIIDGIIGGEGEGPLMPEPVRSGLLIAGNDPVAADVVSSRLMGLDWEKIPKLANYDAGHPYRFSAFNGSVEDIAITWNGSEKPFMECAPPAKFKPASGWRGHIEL